MCKLFLLGGLALPFAASVASAGVVYDNTGTDIFSDGISDIHFDDATASVPAPYTIRQLNLGYFNTASTTSNFDLLVQFYDHVNYNATFGNPVGTVPIGDLIDITNLSAIPSSTAGIGNYGGAGATGLISLTGLLPTSTTGTVGFEFEFVTPGTTAFSESNADTDLSPLFQNAPPNVGTTDPRYGADSLNQNDIVGDGVSGDVYEYQDPNANIYAQLSTTVPEPTSFALLSAGSVMLLSRRKRR